MSVPSLFVLGGARSGKSALAEATGRAFRNVIYLATAHVQGDEDLEDRVTRHKAVRPAHWMTLEPPATLADIKTLVDGAPDGEKPELVIVDCATLWLAWVLTQEVARRSPRQLMAHLEAEGRHFVQELCALGVPFVVVSNEVGEGVVPASAAGRQFRDALGLLNRSLSEACGLSVLLVAGNPLCIRGLEKLQPEQLSTQGLTPVVRVNDDMLCHYLRGSPRGTPTPSQSTST